jgi:cation:H+ antiporter
LVFCVSIAVLVVAANMFISAAEQAGQALGMPPFIVGVVLVGFGTSLPELVASVLAVLAGTSEIVIGSVIGSNITNILLVLGLAGVLGGTFKVKTDLLKFDIPVMLGAAFVLSLMVLDGHFSTGEGFICLIMLSIYLIPMLRSKPAKSEGKPPPRATMRTWIMLVVSPALIFLGAKYTVDSVTALAAIVQIGADVIAMSAIAFGTSLPEIVVAVTATRRGQPEIVVGNIMGSNIFNTFAVMGIPALIGDLTIPEGVVSFSVPMFLAATMMHAVITVDGRVSKGEGAFLISIYLFFIGRLFNWL